jgi:hypothetical protein
VPRATRQEGEEVMFELLALGTLLLFGLLVVGLVGGLLKLAFWVLFLPFRLALKLLALPFLALGLLLKLLFGVLLLPLFLVLGAVAIVGFGLVAVLGLLVPLLPLIVAGLVVWGLVKLLSRPAAATRA